MKQIFYGKLNFLVLALLVCALTLPAFSDSTIAYWRLEEGELGEIVPVEGDGDSAWDHTVIDSSGNENHMRVWADYTSPVYSDDVPFDVVPGTGETNQLSFDHRGGNHDTYTGAATAAMINSYLFGPSGSNAWTVEFSFKVAETSAGQAQRWVGKDEGGTRGPLQMLTYGIGDRFDIRAEILDATIEPGVDNGLPRDVISDRLFDPNQWIHVVATADATTMTLYANVEGRGWELLGVNDELNGALNETITGNWTIGRGYFEGIAHWVNGWSDEVRISDAVRDRSDWLVPAELIFEGPADVNPYLGDDAVFEVSIVEADNEDFSFQWYKSEDPNVTPDDDIMLAAGPELTVGFVQEDDAGFYYCEITDITADRVYYTPAAELVIRYGRVIGEAVVTDNIFGSADVVLPQEDIYYATTMNSEPNSVQGVNFADWSTDHPFWLWGVNAGWSAGTASLNWDPQSEEQEAFEDIVSTFHFSEYALGFNATGLMVGEEYDIHLIFALGEDFNSRSMRVAMFGEFDVEDSVAIFDVERAQAGDPAEAKIVSFTATADADGNIWGEIIEHDTYDPNTGTGYEPDGAVLSAAIVVGEGTITITRQPTDQIVFAGETATFNTEATGVNNLIYTWYRTRTGEPQVGDTAVHTGRVFTINNAQPSDEYFYYCRITAEGVEDLEAVTNVVRLGVKRLRAHWTLDEADWDGYDYIDRSGEGWHLWEASYAPIFVPGVPGLGGDAVLIDEYSSYADIEAFNPSDSTGQLSVSFWVNWYGTNGDWQKFVAKRSTGGWDDDEVMWQVSTNINSSDLWFQTTRSTLSVPGGLTDDGQWQYIVATFDGDVARLYIDGELRAEQEGWEFSANTGARFQLGYGQDGSSLWYCNGEMDEVRIYNYALDPIDIAQTYYDVTGELACIDPPDARFDINEDCVVDAADLADFVLDWLESGRFGEFDPDQD